jgi:hypothetical protein
LLLAYFQLQSHANFAWAYFKLWSCYLHVWSSWDHRSTPQEVPSLFSFFFLVGLGFEPRALHLQSRHSTAWATPPVHFALVILEMWSHELLAWAGLRVILLISASQVARITGLQVCTTGAWLCFWHEILLALSQTMVLLSLPPK